MIEILEFSDLDYKLTVIDMVSALMEKVNNIQRKRERERNS